MSSSINTPMVKIHKSDEFKNILFESSRIENLLINARKLVIENKIRFASKKVYTKYILQIARFSRDFTYLRELILGIKARTDRGYGTMLTNALENFHQLKGKCIESIYHICALLETDPIILYK